MLHCHIKDVNIWKVPVNNSLLFSQISIRCVQVKLTWRKPSSDMLFCLLFLFLLRSKYTNNCKIEETCNLGDMYSYWANSSGVAGNHGSSNIYLSQKSGNTKGLFPEHWLFLCAVTYLLMWDLNTASSFWLVSASLWCHQSILLLWWVMEMHVCKVVWCDYVVITSCIVLSSTAFKGTLNKHWNTERTTRIIKRKMVSSKGYCK